MLKKVTEGTYHGAAPATRPRWQYAFMRNNPVISIIIITCGAQDYLRACLDSLKEQTYPAQEITVISNLPDDPSLRILRQKYPQAKFYSKGINLYYCAALNKGVELSSGDFILCLNDDVILDRGFIRHAIKGFFRSQDRHGQWKDFTQRWKNIRQHRVIFDSLA